MNHERSGKPPGAGKSSFELIEAETFFRALALKPGCTVLEMGCGFGMYTIAMAEIIGDGGRVYAADLWKEGIEGLQERIERRGVKNVIPLLADVSTTLPIPGDSLDLILMATVLHDLKEARRLLKRHGTFAVVEFNKIPGPPGPPIIIRLSPDETAALVEPFGFQQAGLQQIGPYNYLMTFFPKVVCSG
jgi:ubiquinone/menaquinone biosynthesis C-methylase UbiE